MASPRSGGAGGDGDDRDGGGPLAEKDHAYSLVQGGRPPLGRRKMRSLPQRAHKPSRSASISLRGGEWRPPVVSNAVPDPELVQTQTLAEFSRLNLDGLDEGDISTVGPAEESLISLAAGAQKRELDPGTPEDRPVKRRRGLAGTLVGGAVSAAYSLWSSWAHKPSGEDQGGAGDPDRSVTTSVLGTPLSTANRTPTRVTQPPHAVYLSNRRRRAMIPTQRRRAARRPPSKRDSSSSRSSSPFAKLNRGVPTSCPTPSIVPSEDHFTDSPSDDPDLHDDALARMQNRLDTMIHQCRTALSSQPDPEELESVLAQDAAMYPLPSSPPGGLVGTVVSPSVQPVSLSSGPPLTSLLPTAPGPSRTGTSPTKGRPSFPSQIPRTPSRIPVPLSVRAQPPTSTFAFHLRPSSRASGRSFDTPGEDFSRSPSNVVVGSPTSPHRLGHRPSKSASAFVPPSSDRFVGRGSPHPQSPNLSLPPSPTKRGEQSPTPGHLSPRKPRGGRASTASVPMANVPVRPVWRP